MLRACIGHVRAMTVCLHGHCRALHDQPLGGLFISTPLKCTHNSSAVV